MKRAIKISLLLLLAVLMLSSSYPYGNPAPRRTLRILMPLLERSEKVDSCLTVLRSIDTTTLTRPADKARWSLLYAMALDKNYIDTTDLSVLQPAIDHYTHWTHLNRLDKFYTWYYKGRIEENARIYDASLNSYLHAERYMKATDDVYRTRLYFGFERVYAKSISYMKAYDSAKQALHYARNTINSHNIYNALSDCVCNAMVFHDVVSADNYLEEYAIISAKDPDAKVKPVYLHAKMVYYQYLSSEYPDSAKYYLNEYLTRTGINNVDYRSCILMAIKVEDYTLANKLMWKYEEECKKEEDYPSVFYYCRYLVREKQGDLEGAFSDLKREMALVNSRYTFNLDRDIQSLEQKYKNEIIRLRSILIVVTLALSILIMILLVCIELRKKRYIYESLRAEYNVVKREYEGISPLFPKKSSEESDNLGKISSKVMSMASRYNTGKIKSITAASVLLSKKTSPEEVITLVAYLTAVHCRNLFNTLRDRGLTINETGICTLVLMGVRVNELEDILKKKSIYNISRDIRAKLGAKGESASIRHYLEKIYTGE